MWLAMHVHRSALRKPEFSCLTPTDDRSSPQHTDGADDLVRDIARPRGAELVGDGEEVQHVGW